MKREEEKEILLDYFTIERKETKRIKKTYLNRKLEKILININVIIFMFVAMINDFNFKGFLILMALMVVFIVNALIISKYGRILKEIEE